MRSIFAAIFVAGLTALLASCGDEQPGEQGPPPAFPVQVATPLTRTVTPTTTYTGRFVPMEEVELRARVSGYLESVHFKEGQKVKKGDLMFQIDPRPFDALVDAADARLKQAEARLALAKIRVNRVAELVKSGGVSQEDADTRLSELAQAEADILAAEAQLKSASLDREFADVKAPISGIADKFEVTPGNYISGGTQATMLTTIVPHDPIHCVFEVDERQVLESTRRVIEGEVGGRDQEPRSVEIAVSDSDEFEFTGVIDFVENQLDPNTATFQIRALVENKNEFLTPGLFARVRTTQGAAFEGTLVRETALGFDQSKRFAWVIKDEGNGSVVERRFLEVGSLDGEFRVVESGLNEGDKIVVSGIQLLQDGMPVQPTEEPMDPSTSMRDTAEGAADPKAAE